MMFRILIVGLVSLCLVGPFLIQADETPSQAPVSKTLDPPNTAPATSVPEPATVGIVAVGSLGFLIRKRRPK